MPRNGEKRRKNKLCRDTAKNEEKTSFAEIRRKTEKKQALPRCGEKRKKTSFAEIRRKTKKKQALPRCGEKRRKNKLCRETAKNEEKTSFAETRRKTENKQMLTMKRIFEEDKEIYAEIKTLYDAAFPKNERKEIKYLLEKGQDVGEVYAFFDGEKFVGFTCLLNYHSICHVIYFAVAENLRDEGYGTKIIKAVCEAKKRKRVLVDIEMEEDDAPNEAQRVKRKEFYLRNGFKDTEITYRWEGDDYEILSYGGNCTKGEFRAFWSGIYKKEPLFDF